MDVAKREKVLTAALDIFLRYGYKRATMNDIAEAAVGQRDSHRDSK
jgi:AcrR family transcriptional regulator